MRKAVSVVVFDLSVVVAIWATLATTGLGSDIELSNASFYAGLSVVGLLAVFAGILAYNVKAAEKEEQ